MKGFLIKLLLILLTYGVFPNQVQAEITSNKYLNDFYTKSNEAIRILKEIEIELKDGSREKVCAKQREAAKLGLSANNSLIKAFKLDGSQVHEGVLNRSTQRWETLLKKC